MHSPEHFTAGIVGVTGYVGGELARLLLSHPHVELTHVAARSSVGMPLTKIWPQLGHLSELTVIDVSEVSTIAAAVDVLFVALPHGQSQHTVASLFGEDGEPAYACKIIDMSGDFRLDDVAVYESHYGAHTAASLLPNFVYGLTEWMGSHIIEAQQVANPGCFATALGLSLAPLAAAALLPEQVVAVCATGSTGSGKTAKATTHHPARAGNFRLYKVLTHQHVPEVLSLLGKLGDSTKLSFIPASAPMTHGIFATLHMVAEDPQALAELYEQAYADAQFVRLKCGLPELNHVIGSNFADIGVVVGDGELVVACAIDNTLKGAAGQAVQNMNLMLGLDEASGLLNAATIR